MRILKLTALASLSTLFIANSAQAQTDTKDKVLMNNGEQLMGTVTVKDDSTYVLRHIMNADTTFMDLAKKDITRIDYADGRMEQLNFGELSEDAETWAEKMARYKGKVAVLPFVYEDSFSKHETDNMSLQTQMDCIKDIEAVNTVLEIQDLDSVNMKLVENNIDWKNIRDYLPAEIADMLEVEYIVYGTVTVTPIGQPNPEEDKFGTENQTLETPQGRREGDTMAPKKFETIVDLNIYNVLGETVYSNAHESFWQTPDAYNMNLKYLVDESPFNR